MQCKGRTLSLYFSYPIGTGYGQILLPTGYMYLLEFAR